MRKRPPRSGAVLVAALVCLLVSMSIVSTMIAGTLQRRVQLRSLHRVRQAELLVVTARDRALHQLGLDRSYDGEVWTPRLVDEPTELRAEVTIARRSATGASDILKITVVFPHNHPSSVRRSGEFLIPAIATTDSNEDQ